MTTLASSSFISCLTSVLTRRSGGGRAGDDVISRSCRSIVGRCLTEVDFTAVGPVLSIGPSSESEFSGVPESCLSGAGDCEAMRYLSGPLSLDRDERSNLRSLCRDSDLSRDWDL